MSTQPIGSTLHLKRTVGVALRRLRAGELACEHHCGQSERVTVRAAERWGMPLTVELGGSVAVTSAIFQLWQRWWAPVAWRTVELS